MDEKYELMTLKYLYSVLNLKKYEETLKNNGFESLMAPNEDFTYFTLLSRGDTELFSEEERKELTFFQDKSLKEIFSNPELKDRCEKFIQSTYVKYYFSNSNGEYMFYGPNSFEYMVPDDAFALGVNYKSFDFDASEDEFDEKIDEKSKVVNKVMNDIQSIEAKNANLKVGVVKQSEAEILHKSIAF